MKKKKQDEGFFIETIDLTPSNNIQPSNSQDYSYIPEPNYDNGMNERIHEKRFMKKMGRKIKTNLTKIILVLFCAYMVFLIIGALRTNYYVDTTTGTRQPVFVTYKDVADKNDYVALKKHLTELRSILVDVRITEIKLENADISAYDAANQFNSYLAKIDVIIPKLSALDVNSSQEATKTAISSCYTTYLAGYLQEQYKALAKNDVAAQQTVPQYRQLMLQSYGEAEKTLKETADKLKLEDDFFEWELEKAVVEKDSSAVLKSK